MSFDIYSCESSYSFLLICYPTLSFSPYYCPFWYYIKLSNNFFPSKQFIFGYLSTKINAIALYYFWHVMWYIMLQISSAFSFNKMNSSFIENTFWNVLSSNISEFYVYFLVRASNNSLPFLQEYGIILSLPLSSKWMLACNIIKINIL